MQTKSLCRSQHHSPSVGWSVVVTRWNVASSSIRITPSLAVFLRSPCNCHTGRGHKCLDDCEQNKKNYFASVSVHQNEGKRNLTQTARGAYYIHEASPLISASFSSATAATFFMGQSRRQITCIHASAIAIRPEQPPARRDWCVFLGLKLAAF